VANKQVKTDSHMHLRCAVVEWRTR